MASIPFLKASFLLWEIIGLFENIMPRIMEMDPSCVHSGSVCVRVQDVVVNNC